MKTVFPRKGLPEWTVVKLFAAAIFIGTGLLILPFSNTRQEWTDPLTAFFTATSCVCVTGLSVVDIGSHYSLFGQIVMLCLIQLGGLGIMTLGTFLLVLVGRRLSVENEFVMMDSLGSSQVRGLRSLLRRTIVFTFFFEAVTALVIAYRLTTAHGRPAVDALYHGIFHSISAFCNAGFSLYPNSLVDLQSDTWIILAVAAAIVLGGIGFLVLHDLSSLRPWRKNRLLSGRLTLHSKLVIGTTLALILGGWLLFLVLEWDNTLHGLGLKDRLVVSLFQSVTPRTAGFNAVDIGQLKPPTLFFTMTLMFTGGSPASCAGGVKTTTIVVLALTVAAMLRGREETEVFHRSISTHVIREAITIFTLGIFCVALLLGALLITEHWALIGGHNPSGGALLFETISALGTVGLSTGITGDLSVAGKLLVAAGMFVGRLGPLVIALAIGRKDVGQSIRYPEEEVVVG